MQQLHIQIKPEPWMDVMAAIYGRRAVRRYKAEPLTHETIDRLVDAAVQAPSAMDAQPWGFVILEGAEKLRGYSDRARAHFLHSQAVHDARIYDVLNSPEFNMFYGASTLIVICATSTEEQAAEDCCLAAQNLMLVAFSAGLATCPVGFARPWLRLPETKSAIGIPEDLQPVFPLVAGVPAEVPVNPGRRAPHVIWA